MKSFLHLLALAIATSLPSPSQEPASAPQTTPAPGNAPIEQPNNVAGSAKDNGGISGDQATKPAEAKGPTLIGCLGGPDLEGKYVLTSMQHRIGVEVAGPDDLKNDLGSKVKLTGTWEAIPAQQPRTSAKEARRFQATTVEVLSQHCTNPSEKTPISKEKQRQRQEQQQQKNSNPGAPPSPTQ